MTDRHPAPRFDAGVSLFRHPVEWWRAARRRSREKKWEKSSWELREVLRAGISELEALLEAKPLRPDAARLAGDVRRALDDAREKLSHAQHPGHLAGAHLSAAQIHVDGARDLLLRMIEPEEVAPLLPGLVALVREHLPVKDPRRARAEDIWKEVHKRPPTPADVEAILDAVNVARQQALRDRLRVGSFVRIVKYVAVALGVLAVLVGVLGFLYPWVVPLCFTPEAPPVQGGEGGPRFVTVCSVASSDELMSAPQPSGLRDLPAIEFNYVVVEIVGLLAAAIAAASALRRMSGTATPYDVPVALAWLKLPTGALTAVLGLLLMRGGFVPGLTALDSSAQIIAWAIVFGYSQQIFTQFVDKQGQALLAGVRGPGAAPPPNPGPPAAPAE
ncbi:hypothetical protein ACWD6P_21230 [Streptomyces sp. NPDC002446]